MTDLPIGTALARRTPQEKSAATQWVRLQRNGKTCHARTNPAIGTVIRVMVSEGDPERFVPSRLLPADERRQLGVGHAVSDFGLHGF
jgi:hypothetical protein